MITNEYCDEFWALYDLLCELQDAKEKGVSIDPKAIKRAKDAVELHKDVCKECLRAGQSQGTVDMGTDAEKD